MAIQADDAAARERRRQLMLVSTADDEVEPLTDQPSHTLSRQSLRHIEAVQEREIELRGRRYLALVGAREMRSATVGVVTIYGGGAQDLTRIRRQARDPEAQILMEELLDAVQTKLGLHIEALIEHTNKQLVKAAQRPIMLEPEPVEPPAPAPIEVRYRDPQPTMFGRLFIRPQR